MRPARPVLMLRPESRPRPAADSRRPEAGRPSVLSSAASGPALLAARGVAGVLLTTRPAVASPRQQQQDGPAQAGRSRQAAADKAGRPVAGERRAASQPGPGGP